MDIPPELVEQIKRHEGLRLEAYRDTRDKLTIGYGHLMHPRDDPKMVMTEEEAEEQLFKDLRRTRSEMSALSEWTCGLEETDVVRYCVLWNMAFNMGIGHLRGFKNMLAAVKERDWAMAVHEMESSKWRGQIGKTRFNELAAQMETGIFQK